MYQMILKNPVCECVYVCTRFCLCTCMHVCVCARMYGSQRLMLGVVLNTSVSAYDMRKMCRSPFSHLTSSVSKVE